MYFLWWSYDASFENIEKIYMEAKNGSKFKNVLTSSEFQWDCMYITPYEKLAKSLWLTSDKIICYHLIIFTVLDREQILLTLVGEKPVLICCLSGSLWPAESDKASLQSSPCGNETQHITCCLKCLLFLSKAWHVLMKCIHLLFSVRFCFDFLLLNSTA